MLPISAMAEEEGTPIGVSGEIIAFAPLDETEMSVSTGTSEDAAIGTYKHSSFTDVKANAYYMGYIEWGVKNNILVGIGGGKFDRAKQF